MVGGNSELDTLATRLLWKHRISCQVERSETPAALGTERPRAKRGVSMGSGLDGLAAFIPPTAPRPASPADLQHVCSAVHLCSLAIRR
jgi:hypothetical protein